MGKLAPLPLFSLKFEDLKRKRKMLNRLFLFLTTSPSTQTEILTTLVPRLKKCYGLSDNKIRLSACHISVL